MRKIVQMARLELAVLFYSPIAWLLLIIFLIQCGMAYTDMLYRMETDQQLGRSLPQLTRALFSGDQGVLTQISKTLYLYIPLLTMSTISRELGSGSIKLLQSSPITNMQIVLGKYLGMMGYGVLLCAMVLICALLASFSVQSLDFGFILGGLAGLLLLLSAYVALGLFMSSLTAYPIVAAISTLAALAALDYVGLLGQTVDGLRELTYWMSLSGKIDGIINGLITTRELAYFIGVTGFFLILTVLKLGAGRKSTPFALRLGTILGLVAGLFVLVFVSSRPGWIQYWDTTRTKDQTLSKKSQDLLKQVEDAEVRLVSYTNLLDRKVDYGEPVNRIKDRLRFERYQRFLPKMQIEYVAYYDSVPYMRDTLRTLEEQAAQVAKVKHFSWKQVLTPEQIREQIDLRGEDNGFVRMLSYKGKTTPLRMYDDLFQYPGESEVMAAFKRVVDSPAKVWILDAHGERSIQRMDQANYQVLARGNAVRASLTNQGFDSESVALDTVGQIPLELATLIIADPMELYSEEELEKIQDYIERGGHLLLAGEPRRADIFNRLAQSLGVQMLPGTLMQESAYHDADLVFAGFTPVASNLGLGLFERSKVSMPHVGALTLVSNENAEGQPAFQATPILMSDSVSTWRYHGEYDLNLEKIRFDSSRDQKERSVLLYALTREVSGREQRIIVSGDADFLSNQELLRFGVQNPSFVISRLFRWFTFGEFPFAPNGEAGPDRVVRVSRGQINQQQILLFGILPVLIVGTGAVVLMRRRRK